MICLCYDMFIYSEHMICYHMLTLLRETPFSELVDGIGQHLQKGFVTLEHPASLHSESFGFKHARAVRNQSSHLAYLAQGELRGFVD